MSDQSHQQDLDAFYRRQIGDRRVFWKDKYKPYLSLYRDRLLQRNAAIESALPRRMVRALDLGCGQGDLLEMLASRADEVLGADFSPIMVKTASANLSELPNVRVFCSSAEKLDLSAASLDVIIMADVIEHLREPLVCLRECRRVLKPGGLIVITTPNAVMEKFWKRIDGAIAAPFRLFRRKRTPVAEVFERLFNRAALVALAADAGFRIRDHRLIEFYPGSEGGGTFGRLLRLIARQRHMRQWLVEPLFRGLFGLIESFGILNNRQLLVLEFPV